MLKSLAIISLICHAAFASADKACEANASRVIDRFFRTVEVDSEIAQPDYVRELQLIDLRKMTPGQQNQEYVGTFEAHYRPGEYAFYERQTLRVVFRSSVGCEQLKVFAVYTDKNVLTDYGSAARNGTKNTFSCEARR